LKKLVLACAVVFSACENNSLPIDLSNPTVELDAFSGRPNPRWQLTAVEAGELEDRLSGIPETSPAAIPDNLGYRGFRILDGSQRITVSSNGYIVVHDAKGDKFYRDTKGVEDLLIEQAQKRGYGQLLIRTRQR
jgi:hypothetical protein